MGEAMSQIWFLLIVVFAVGAHFGWRRTRPRRDR